MTDEPPIPFDTSLEQALIGALLVNNYDIPQAINELAAAHFYDPLHHRLYAAIGEMWDAGRTVSPITLKAVMAGDAGFAEVGGQAYLVSLARAAPALPNVAEYARILRDLALRRDALEALAQATEDVRASPAPVSEVLGPLLALADEAERVVTRGALVTHSQSVQATLAEVEATRAGKPIPAIYTGLNRIDRKTGGFRGADLVVVPGRSGAGKSALLGCVALNNALRGVPVIVFSLEMKTRHWVERDICNWDYNTSVKPMTYQAFRTGKISDDEFDRAYMAGQAFHELPLVIDDTGGLTMEQIAARSRAFAAKHRRLGLVVVDYMQKIRADSRRQQSREQDVSGFAVGCKNLAKRLDWVVMAGAQLLSKGDDRVGTPRRPTLGDIRESGALEFEADFVLAPHRDAWFTLKARPSSTAGAAEWLEWTAKLKGQIHRMDVLGLKNRHGAEFEANLFCDMGSSAIRDDEPVRGIAEHADDDLLGRYDL